MAKKLLDESIGAVDQCMRISAEKINERFGHGYAEQNPNLIGAFMISMAISLSAAGSYDGLEKLSDAIKYQ